MGNTLTEIEARAGRSDLLASCRERFPGNQLGLPCAAREFPGAARASANGHANGWVD